MESTSQSDSRALSSIAQACSYHSRLRQSRIQYSLAWIQRHLEESSAQSMCRLERRFHSQDAELVLGNSHSILLGDHNGAHLEVPSEIGQ